MNLSKRPGMVLKGYLPIHPVSVINQKFTSTHFICSQSKVQRKAVELTNTHFITSQPIFREKTHQIIRSFIPFHSSTSKARTTVTLFLWYTTTVQMYY